MYWYVQTMSLRIDYRTCFCPCANKIGNFRLRFQFRRTSSPVSSHLEGLTGIIRWSSQLIEYLCSRKIPVCRGWCFHIDQLKLLTVCLVRCYVHNSHFGFEPIRKGTVYTKVPDIDSRCKCIKSKCGMHKIGTGPFDIIRRIYCTNVTVRLYFRYSSQEAEITEEKKVARPGTREIGFHDPSRSLAEISARSDTRMHVSKISFRSSRVSKLRQNIQSPARVFFVTRRAT